MAGFLGSKSSIDYLQSEAGREAFNAWRTAHAKPKTETKMNPGRAKVSQGIGLTAQGLVGVGFMARTKRLRATLREMAGGRGPLRRRYIQGSYFNPGR